MNNLTKADIERIKEALSLLRHKHRPPYNELNADFHNNVINHCSAIDKKLDEIKPAPEHQG
jgi:hypothetical protein